MFFQNLLFLAHLNPEIWAVGETNPLDLQGGCTSAKFNQTQGDSWSYSKSCVCILSNTQAAFSVRYRSISMISLTLYGEKSCDNIIFALVYLKISFLRFAVLLYLVLDCSLTQHILLCVHLD